MVISRSTTRTKLEYRKARSTVSAILEVVMPKANNEASTVRIRKTTALPCSKTTPEKDGPKRPVIKAEARPTSARRARSKSALDLGTRKWPVFSTVNKKVIKSTAAIVARKVIFTTYRLTDAPGKKTTGNSSTPKNAILVSSFSR